MPSTLEQPEIDLGNQPSEGFVSEDARRAAETRRTVRERHRQALNLQRESILSQRCSKPMRRVALEGALAQIEAEIQALK